MRLALLLSPLLLAACAGLTTEAQVQRRVAEDDQNRIEELRVRGQTQKITVQPKGGTTKGYEIVTSDGGNDPSQQRTAKRAVGERVWSIFSF